MSLSIARARPGTLARRGRRVALLRYALLIPICIVLAFPFYWVVLTSLVPSDHVFDFPPSLWPRWWDFGNYSAAWHGSPWPNYFLNTAIIAVGTTLLVLCTATLAGFCLATMSFAGKRLLTGLIFASLIMPAIVVIIPDYVIANSLGWLNTYQVQIVPWGASTFGIFLLWQAFRGLPAELYDAARIDGCSRRFYLWAVGVPLVRPALTTVALYIFLGSYNALLWPLVMTSSNGTDAGVQPIEVGVYSFIGENGTAFNQLCAAVVFTMLPVILIFLLLQRQFMEGVMRSGLKG